MATVHGHLTIPRGLAAIGREHQTGCSSTTNVPYNTVITAFFETNLTNNVSGACIGNSCTNWEAFTRDPNPEGCFAMSFTNITGGAFQIFNVTGTQNLKCIAGCDQSPW